MRSLSCFTQLSLDGYYADHHDELGWAHQNADAEWNQWVAGNAGGGGMLLFGRITYEMMIKWWPTPQAIQSMPEVANAMNAMPKAVFSRSMDRATWNNTIVVNDLIAGVKKLKSEPGPDMAILGSGSIVAQLAEANLIDAFQVVINPIALGAGKQIFAGVKNSVRLKLTRSQQFGNGNVVLWYDPK